MMIGKSVIISGVLVKREARTSTKLRVLWRGIVTYPLMERWLSIVEDYNVDFDGLLEFFRHE